MKTFALAGAAGLGNLVGPIITLLVIVILLGILAANVKEIGRAHV